MFDMREASGKSEGFEQSIMTRYVQPPHETLAFHFVLCHYSSSTAT